jgi:hypothetical protein
MSAKLWLLFIAICIASLWGGVVWIVWHNWLSTIGAWSFVFLFGGGYMFLNYGAHHQRGGRHGTTN